MYNVTMTCPVCGKEFEVDLDTEIIYSSDSIDASANVKCKHCSNEFNIDDYINSNCYVLTEQQLFAFALVDAQLISEDDALTEGSVLCPTAFEMFKDKLQLNGYYTEKESNKDETHSNKSVSPEELFNEVLVKCGICDKNDASSMHKAHIAWLCFVDSMEKSDYLN